MEAADLVRQVTLLANLAINYAAIPYHNRSIWPSRLYISYVCHFCHSSCLIANITDYDANDERELVMNLQCTLCMLKNHVSITLGRRRG